MKKIGVTIILILLILTASASVLATHKLGLDREAVKDISKAKRATDKYQNVKNAIRDGYISTEFCVENPELGAMGIHYMNPMLMDNVINVKKPEALLYLPTKRGLKLVGVEYFIPSSETNVTPMLFGKNFDGPMPGHSPEMPEHYDFHAWIWKHNPSGIFSQFNPAINCQNN